MVTYIKQNRSEEWSTPQELFDHYNHIFNFTVDAAASADNAKCERFYSKQDNGLTKDWTGERVWCNPPYGKQIGQWVAKCYNASVIKDTLVVALLPSRTDTIWFHKYINGKAIVQYLPGRLHFNESKHSAAFGSMLVIWGI